MLESGRDGQGIETHYIALHNDDMALMILTRDGDGVSTGLGVSQAGLP